MPTLLTNRQEAFCRHYAVSGSAAGAARAAGYSEKCARQQGYENLQKPFVLIRLEEIRRGFAETAGREAAILLSRLEQVWAVAAAAGSMHFMTMTLAMEAKLSGVLGNADTKLRLWGPDGQAGPLERAVERAGDADALAAAEAAAPRDPARARRRDAPPAHVFEDELEPDGVADGGDGLDDAGLDDDGLDDAGLDDDGALWHAVAWAGAGGASEDDGATDEPASSAVPPHPANANAAGPSLSLGRGRTAPAPRTPLSFGEREGPGALGSWEGEGSPPEDFDPRDDGAHGRPSKPTAKRMRNAA